MRSSAWSNKRRRFYLSFSINVKIVRLSHLRILELHDVIVFFFFFFCKLTSKL